MPRVGGKRFPYTSAGAQQAQKFARQTGQQMSMKKGGSASSKIKKVIGKLNKASKAHASQAKTLKSIMKKKGKKGGNMKLLEDVWAWLKEWNNWKAKDWIKAGVVAVAVILIIGAI